MTNPLIVALDVPSAGDARALVRAIGPAVDFYKVGMELYAAAGMDFVRELLGQGKQVFLDLKFYDIGETVKRAVARVATSGVRFLTVHGSTTVLRAAVEGRGDSRLQLLAVTVLTSYTQQDLDDMGFTGSLADLVDLRVRRACEAGIDGIVCSPLEVARVRAIAGPGRVLVTPGIRPSGADPGDQRRLATARQAIENGADFLVIGRPITRAADPAAAASHILASLR
jgi:orotidine-5'-phosphate decarboxylase